MSFHSPLLYFTDSLLRAPTIACMLMCLSSSLIGVYLFLRKQSLVGESLSHASYPGVMLAVTIGAYYLPEERESAYLAMMILAGAFFSSAISYWVIDCLIKNFRVRSDSALCFVLSAAFGIGLTGASMLQFSHTYYYKQIQMYLYGQAATMTDFHIYLYATLSALVLAVVLFLYKELKVITFDRAYALSLGIPTGMIDRVFFCLLVLSVVIGIRSVGIVLMSGMLIAPPIAARQWTDRLSRMLVLSSLFGMASGFLGNYLSVELSFRSGVEGGGQLLGFPTGPMIVLIAAFFSFFSLIFASERGFFRRIWRIFRFHNVSIQENILKGIWRLEPNGELSFEQIRNFQVSNSAYLKMLLFSLQRKGWVKRGVSGGYVLTEDGEKRASWIVRLHRLWELYLVDRLGLGIEQVHKSAEEMEHIITPEIEERLTQLLCDPKEDPHKQPIPRYEETL
jgi:manganese/zinc/iron transport system permease protein